MYEPVGAYDAFIFSINFEEESLIVLVLTPQFNKLILKKGFFYDGLKRL